MSGSRGSKLAVAVAAFAVLGGAQLAARALASGLPAVAEAEAEPGISITGIGFARSQDGAASDPTAVTRAVRNARSRAGSIARALGLRVGGVAEVELRELTQFGSRRPSGIAGAAATVRFAIVGGAPDADGLREVEAYGSASAPVRPADLDRSRPIKRAVLAARRMVTPEAAAAARSNAAAAARSAGWALSEIVSIVEAPAPYYGYGSSFYDPALGSFGPGRFCGFYRRAVIRPDPRTGVPRVVRRVPRRSCTFQSRYSLDLEIAYRAQPSPSMHPRRDVRSYAGPPHPHVVDSPHHGVVNRPNVAKRRATPPAGPGSGQRCERCR